MTRHVRRLDTTGNGLLAFQVPLAGFEGGVNRVGDGIAVLAASAALYRTFAFGGLRGRGRTLAESSVVTAAAVAGSLVLTMLTLLVAFALLCWAGAATVFPRKLMETWPTVDPAVRALDHAKVSLFIAAFAVLAGSLGGRADRRDLVRGVLFADEEA